MTKPISNAYRPLSEKYLFLCKYNIFMSDYYDPFGKPKPKPGFPFDPAPKKEPAWNPGKIADFQRKEFERRANEYSAESSMKQSIMFMEDKARKLGNFGFDYMKKQDLQVSISLKKEELERTSDYHRKEQKKREEDFYKSLGRK